MSGYSNVGSSGVYEAGDQRNVKTSDLKEQDKFHEGKLHSHKNLDSKDERSIANKLAAEEQSHDVRDTPETRMSKQDATKPAVMHGNEPSKGAKIDEEIREDEQAELKRLGKE